MKRGDALAAVILPNAELVGVVFGAASTVWLKAFRNSARNCRRARSLRKKFLTPDIFHMSMLGPRTPEKRVGRVTMFEASWSADLVPKAAVLNQWAMVR